MRAFVVLLLMAASLSGCTEGGGGSSEATVKELREPAEAAAKDWAEDARLFGAITIESTVSGAGEALSEDFAEFEIFEEFFKETDAAPGDGRAPMWGYLFARSGNDEAVHIVIMGADGKVRATDTVAAPTDGSGPLDDWRLDSDEAADRARSNPEYAAASDNAVAAMMFLFDDEETGGPTYGAMAANAAGGFAFVFVDADSGDVVPLDLGGPDPGPEVPGGPQGRIEPESGTGATNVMVVGVAPSEPGAFALVATGHPSMRVSWASALQPAGVPGPYTLTLEGPGYVQSQTSLYLLGGDANAFEVPFPQAGAWTLTVEGPISAPPVNFAWCAEGLDMATGDPIPC